MNFRSSFVLICSLIIICTQAHAISKDDCQDEQNEVLTFWKNSESSRKVVLEEIDGFLKLVNDYDERTATNFLETMEKQRAKDEKYAAEKFAISGPKSVTDTDRYNIASDSMHVCFIRVKLGLPKAAPSKKFSATNKAVNDDVQNTGQIATLQPPVNQNPDISTILGPSAPLRLNPSIDMFEISCTRDENRNNTVHAKAIITLPPSTNPGKGTYFSLGMLAKNKQGSFTTSTGAKIDDIQCGPELKANYDGCINHSNKVVTANISFKSSIPKGSLNVGKKTRYTFLVSKPFISDISNGKLLVEGKEKSLCKLD